MQKINMTISQAFPRSIWMIGEVQNLNLRAKGCFFNLADLKENASKSASITASCVIWSSTMKHLKETLKTESLENILQDGMKIRVLVTVNFYKDRGQISLGVQDIDPRFTKGALALAREELMKELRQKGLDRLNPSLSLSPFPFKIGLISADGSRAKSDFLDQLHLYKFPGQVIFYAAAMQGENTLTEVCRGISELEEHQCDLIVVTRGGGSLADLRWFDSKQIALAIANCKVPVLAAIGHQDDVVRSRRLSILTVCDHESSPSILLQTQAGNSRWP
jgi:exodeoxyribonuclease VII large subunit